MFAVDKMPSCLACRNGHKPTQHYCIQCNKYVHLLDECSKSIGNGEGSGEKRLCSECDKSTFFYIKNGNALY